MPAEVVFNASEMSKEITVTASDDDVDDDGERVELTFGDAARRDGSCQPG